MVAAAAPSKKGKQRAQQGISRWQDRQELETPLQFTFSKECTLLREIVNAIAGFSTAYIKVIFCTTLPVLIWQWKQPQLEWMGNTDTVQSHQRVRIKPRGWFLASVCLKTPQELYLTQNPQLRKGETNSFTYCASRVTPGSKGLIDIHRDLSFCVVVQSDLPNPQHVQALLVPRKKLTQDYLTEPLISKSSLGFFVFFSWNSSIWPLVFHHSHKLISTNKSLGRATSAPKSVLDCLERATDHRHYPF